MKDRSHDTPVVQVRQFIQSARDVGYKSPEFAIFELVDNAVQAGATQVRVRIVGGDRRDGSAVREIAVEDNGVGMTPRQLSTSLSFGGSTRYGDRSGLGRYGMGLPSSSISQARRVDVYSWRRRTQVW